MNQQPIEAIVMKRGKWYIGTLDNTDFYMDAAFDGDLPDGYVSLYDYLVLTNPKMTKKESEVIRKEIGYTKVFVYVTNSDDFWGYTNQKCNTCKRACKQSHKVEVCYCPTYEEDNGTD